VEGANRLLDHLESGVMRLMIYQASCELVFLSGETCTSLVEMMKMGSKRPNIQDAQLY